MEEHWSNKSRIESLDGLRGIAALMVVLGHSLLAQPFYWALYFGPSAGQPSQWDWMRTTPLRLIWSSDKAVILFFVLSGFVLALPWVNGRQKSYSNFFISRIYRIGIPYYVAMFLGGGLATLIAGRHIDGASDWVNLYGWANHVSPLSIPGTILMLGNQYSTWLDNVTWTLVWEMRVSFLFPFLVIPVLRWGLRGVGAVAVSLWVLYALGGMLDSAFAPASAMLGNPYKTFYYAAFFLLGITIARYRDTLTGMTSLGRGAGSTLLVLLASCVWLHKWNIHYPDVMKAVGAALFLIAAASVGIARSWLNTAPVQWLGRVSYSLYLIHVPIILTGEYLLYPRYSHVTIVCIAAPLSLVCAEIFYRLVERPAHAFGRHLVRQRETVANKIRADIEVA